MKYKMVDKYLNKNKKKKNIFLSIANKILICILLFIIGITIVKIDKNRGSKIYKYLYEKNISFAALNNIYQKYLGDILPFQNITNSNVTDVFNEKLKYKEANIYKDGVALTVDESYLVPVLEKGVVVFSGDKEGYGKVVIVQQTDGLYVWYGNLSNINVSLYDYVNKGEFLAEANEKLYLVFQKGEEFLDYKKFIK